MSTFISSIRDAGTALPPNIMNSKEEKSHLFSFLRRDVIRVGLKILNVGLKNKMFLYYNQF